MKRKHNSHYNLMWQAKIGIVLFVLVVVVAIILKLFGIELQ